jgi:hypothetical protein
VGSSLALLAFVVAFYALLARERKTPYITNYIFPPAAVIFFGVLLVLFELLLQGWRVKFSNVLAPVTSISQNQVAPIPRIDYVVIIGAIACFCAGCLMIFRNIWRLHNRQVHFRDDNLLKNLSVVRWCRNLLRRQRTDRSYEYSPAHIDDSIVQEALRKSAIKADVEASAAIRTVAFCGYSIAEADHRTSVLAAELLKAEWLVQYTTCCRHPYEWVNKVKQQAGNEWETMAARISVVDAYTPHFGFTDSVHARKTDEVMQEGVDYVSSPESYAGVHSATAKAFNVQKSRAEGNLRRPTLLIYEGCRALADLESVEQYRLFRRHVLTSERMWGGMVTIFVEPEAEEPDVSLMRSYADCMTLRGTGGEEVRDVKIQGSANL